MITGGKVGVEASREHGMIAGLLTGGIKINAQLTTLIKQLDRTAQVEVLFDVDPSVEIPDMLQAAVAVLTQTIQLLEQLRQTLNL